MIGVTRPYTLADSTNSLGRSLCQALGLEGRKVFSLDVRFRVDEVPTITVGEFVSVPEPERLRQVFEKYELTKCE
jgi:hypothetical protein